MCNLPIISNDYKITLLFPQNIQQKKYSDSSFVAFTRDGFCQKSHPRISTHIIGSSPSRYIFGLIWPEICREVISILMSRVFWKAQEDKTHSLHFVTQWPVICAREGCIVISLLRRAQKAIGKNTIKPLNRDLLLHAPGKIG